MCKKPRTFNKIFNIGLPKTGTNSLTQALTILGFKTIHNPHHFRRLSLRGEYNFGDNFDALANFCEHFYPQVDKAYPNSKFILTVREEVAWLDSWKRESQERTGNEPWPIITKENWYKPKTWKKLAGQVRREIRNNPDIRVMHTRIEVFGTYKFHSERCSYVFQNHLNNAIDYFKNRPKDLLIMDIPSGDGWNILCPFLGISRIPDEPFPYLYKQQTMAQKQIE